MLPTHHPVSSDPGVSNSTLQKYFSRRSIRWISWSLIITIAIYFVGPFVLSSPPFQIDIYDRLPNLSLVGPGHQEDLPPAHPVLIPLPLPLTEPPSLPPTSPNAPWSGRAEQVRSAFRHAYLSYLKHAAPYDEILPVTGGKLNNFNGWGVSLFDALDTLWIMGFHEEFRDAIPVVARTNFSSSETAYAPFFETVIRYLGGLLSAYALSGEPILLSRADDLGRMLLPALNTPTGFPMYSVDPKTGATSPGWTGGVLFAEMLSNQLEYKYLAHLTGRTEYYNKVERIMQTMYTAQNFDGLFPTLWSPTTGRPDNRHLSVGAFGDSGYEYFLKQWLLTGQSEPKAREMYLKSVAGIIKRLLFVSPKRGLLYVTDVLDQRPRHILEHLSCFLPGVLALGVHTLELSPQDKELHAWAARGLAYTCWITYADQASGLGPDEVNIDVWEGGPKADHWVDHLEAWEKAGRPGGVPPGLEEVKPEPNAAQRGYSNQRQDYLLRPETVESFYLLWRTTGDEAWRERGWAVFQAIEKHTRTEYGYSSVSGVDTNNPAELNSMPSYFLAETLKYLFLLFTDEEIIPLNKWVFNTEAHPLPVFNWSNWEQEEYHILHVPGE